MKKILIVFLILAAVMASYCHSGKGNTVNSDPKTSKSEISFREYQHDFGKVTNGEKVSCIFTFDNKGTTDLVLTSATTTCGCTVPKYDTNPIAPGASGTLEVIFDTSGRSGMQTKTITVKSNARTPVVILKITAEVVTSEK